MAFVHPSRMALVPNDSGSVRPSGSRQSSPPASGRGQNEDRYQRSRNEEYNAGRGQSGRRDHSRDYKDRNDERRRDQGRSSDRNVSHDQDSRQSRHRSKGDSYYDCRDENAEVSNPRGVRAQRDDRSSERSPPPTSRPPLGRASPRYDDYSRRVSTPPPLPHNDKPRRPDTPPENAPPWRQQENMYRRDGRWDGGGDYFERRRQQRVNSTFSIWPPSPRAPARDPSLERDLESRKKHKRDHSTSVSSSSMDSEEDRRRRKRKERKRARKEREKERRHRHAKYSDDEAREHHRDSRRKRSRPTSREPRKARSRAQSPHRVQSSGEDEWMEKPSGSFVPAVPTTIPPPNISLPSAIRTTQKNANDEDASDEDVGPQPAPTPQVSKKLDERAYGGALLRGEGSAMAAFLQDGTDVRIPRRGEIGLTSGEIGKFEAVGYVMSGSRHRRMNAVRMRKENQVISAEEKRGILKLQQEEKQRREAILREEFQELLTDQLKEGTKASS